MNFLSYILFPRIDSLISSKFPYVIHLYILTKRFISGIWISIGSFNIKKFYRITFLHTFQTTISKY